MDETTGGESDELQFDQAEYEVAPAMPTAAVVSRPAVAAATCIACKKPIRDSYYAVGQKIVCEPCGQAFLARRNGGYKATRFGKALLYGLGAAVVGSAIWLGVRALTGYEIGIVAIVVGVIVGGAVRKGSGNRGGLAYQLLAVFLTYSCIVSTYVPTIFSEMRNQFNQRHPAVASTMPAAVGATAGSGARIGGSSSADAPPTHRQTSPVRLVLALLLLSIIVFAIAFVAPVLAGVSNLLGLIIIAIALWQAWKINRGNAIQLSGPFKTTQGGAIGAVGGPAGAAGV